MSKITYSELLNFGASATRSNKIMGRIEQREAEFAKLVNAVGVYVSDNKSMIPTYLSAAYEPFLPPPSPADRLDAYKNKYVSQPSTASEILDDIIAELREGEK